MPKCGLKPTISLSGWRCQDCQHLTKFSITDREDSLIAPDYSCPFCGGTNYVRETISNE